MTKSLNAPTFQQSLRLFSSIQLKCSRHHDRCQTRRHLPMTSPAVGTAFALTSEVLVPSRLNCSCDLGPKERRPRPSTQISQRHVAMRSDAGASTVARKQHQRHKLNRPSQHGKPTSRTRYLVDIESSKLRRRIRHPPICLALIPDTSMAMDTPTSSSRTRGVPRTPSSPLVLRAPSHHPTAEVRDSCRREQMESLAARLGSVVLQQIGHLMEMMGQTHGMSTYSIGDRSHVRAAGRRYCRKDETETPSHPSRIAQEGGTAALSPHIQIDPLFKANTDPNNCLTAASDDLLSPHAPAPLVDTSADPPHGNGLNPWLWLMLPLRILGKGGLHLSIAAISMVLLSIKGCQSRAHGPPLNRITGLGSGKGSRPEVSYGSESRKVGAASSHKGQSSTRGMENRSTQGKRQRGDDSQSNAMRKRKSKREFDGHDEDDDNDEWNKKPPLAPMRSEADYERFACPFLKHDPQKYGSEKSCLHHWSSVHRVKEHLYRRHLPPKFQCLRCHERFINESVLRNHQRQPEPCKAEPKDPDWISQEQVNMLRNQRNRSASQEEKWRDMYNILFPEEESIPNPYYTYEDTHSVVPDGSSAPKQRLLDPSLDAKDYLTLFANKHGQIVSMSDTSPDFALNPARRQQSPPGIRDGTRKGRRDSEEQSNKGNDVDDGHTPRKSARGDWPIRHSEEERQPDSLLACPFYKLDPYRHYRCLEKHKLKRLADVRQHINRAHVVRAHYCPMCWAIFQTKGTLDSHVGAGNCPGLPELTKIGIDNPILHGLLPEEAERLAVLPRGPTETDKWYWLWDTLFSEHPRPASPYVMEGIAEPMALLARDGEHRLQENLPALLRAHNNPSDPESMANLARDITRVFSDIPTPASHSSFRKFPTENPNAVTIAARGEPAVPMEMPLSIMDDAPLSTPHSLRSLNLGFYGPEATEDSYLASQGFFSAGESSREEPGLQFYNDSLNKTGSDLLDDFLDNSTYTLLEDADPWAI